MGVASPLCLLVYLLCQFLSINSLVSNDPVLPVPLNVVVWTSNLKRILPAALKTQLEIILPRYFPAIEAGKPVHDIQLLLNYEVNIVADSFHLNYETFIKSKPVHANGFHMVLIDQLTSFLQEEVNAGAFGSSLNQADIFTLPVLILNTEKVAKHMIVHSEDRIAECAMSVLSSVAFLDLNAKVCDVTKSVSHESRHVRWSTPALSAPFPFTYLFSKGVAYKPENSVYNNYLTARVAGLVTSAIQVMSTGNLDWRPSHATERIFCPIVIIKNDNSNTTNTQPDLIAIQKWLKSILLPHQEVVLVSTDHYIDEHPQISVAIASSHMTFAASVLGNLEMPDTHIERIPFIDTNLLFHELSSVGDKLCDLLLHQTGHSETLNALLESESIREQESDLITPKIKVGRSDLTSKEKAWRAAVIVPVFVISDLHIHHERHLSSASSGRQTAHPSARPDIPVQPLFNKNEAIAIDSDSSSVLVLHTTEPVVSTFSPHTKSWKENDLTDLDSLIAEGLTRALTGFNAPHAQLSESFDIIDLTWTHGPHPFAPFGHLSSTAADSEHSIFSTSIRRSILIARAHRAMQRSISVSHRATAIETEISDAFRYLHSLHGSSRQAGKSFASVNSKSRTGGHTVGDKVLDTHTELPKLMLDQIKEVSEKSKILLSRIQLLRESFKNKNVEKIMAAFGEIEKNLEKFESEIENVENVMHLQLKNCFVAFDIDPHLIDKLSDRKLSQSAYDRMSMSPHARRKDHNAFDAGQFNMLYYAFAVMGLLIVGAVLLNVHIRITNQAKKKR